MSSGKCKLKQDTTAHSLLLVTQSCPILFGSYVHGDSPGKNTGMGCHVLFQGIFPTQVFHIAGRFFTVWATGEAQEYWSG